ncbi:low molecular weight phosphotyrosine protein phosphatase [Nitrosomonas sp. JL21]|uniref:low molecular weight protein-tyrosine-phosphatase n=1 Tax=Nitrosomonas sp. JL21 TaxID=153949 RepID=UPI00136F2221|nr:low molecular weight protein-tyrosine-phosphatase [Nitrosomonas sp. JL21]MBL8498810.1 low molecular weight phosphotyrosine protein phosphatase [Nitrosomonas sp.]MCC7091052.1 low molecular weight phosphotyrosine protein phosphatase [Nitrosomonas sp.]MXS78021.1 low molecular weight phosphotyrosine protein phosphatase [Nitrosomonas sp. JL21]
MDKIKKIKVLFVCMGNICRSPTADAVFRHFVKEARVDHLIEVDSAGTHAYHIGNPPDHRTQHTASKRGYAMHELRARAVQTSDFEEFDYILAMDKENLSLLHQRSPRQHLDKIQLFMQYSQNAGLDTEVPDPYFGGDQGFELVLDMVEDASRGLLAHLCTHNS